MASFHNFDNVQHQIGHQVNNGDTIFGNVNNFYNTSASEKQQRVLSNESAANEQIDQAMLRSLAFPQMLDRRNNVERPHTATCQWVFDLEGYRVWKTAKSGLLWIKGKPGSGKSTLMTQIYHELHSQSTSDSHESGIHLEFFFNGRGVPLQRSSLGMLRSLSNQLIRRDSQSRDLFRRTYREKCAYFGQSENPGTWEWQCPELEALLLDAILASAKTRQVIILIDALDEAGGQDARELARYFHKINAHVVSQKSAAKICISCRHYPIPTTVKSIEIHVEKHNHDDIASYVKDYLDTANLPQHQEWDDLAEHVIARARGVFLWIRLVVPMVKKHIDDFDAPEDVREWLSQVPQKLEEMYKHILESVVDHRHRVKSFRLFQWVCFATRPLSPGEMRSVLGANDGSHSAAVQSSEWTKWDDVMEAQVKSYSGGLLEVAGGSGREWDDNTKLIQVSHQSVKDFFATQGLPFFATLNGTGPHTTEECHGALYWSCLSYVVSASASFLASDQPEIRWLWKLSAQFPLFDYAMWNMFVHAEKAQSSRSPNQLEEYGMLEKVTLVLAGAQDRGFHKINRLPICRDITLLHLLALVGLGDLVRHALSGIAMVDIHDTDEDGWSALHYAIAGRHLEIAELLVSAGASVNPASPKGETPLMMVARRGDVESFTWLLQHGANINTHSSHHESVLRITIRNNHIALTKVCIDAGADVNARGTFSDPALLVASGHNSLEAVSLLIAAGADVNAKGGDFDTALRVASRRGFAGVVELLIRAGADVNAQGRDFETALQVASHMGFPEVVRLLIAAGADVNARGGPFGTALQVAAGGRSQVVCLLIEAGADLNIGGGLNGSALQAASHYGSVEIVRSLIRAGADVNAKGGYHGTALQAAIQAQEEASDRDTAINHSQIIQMLRAAGAK